MFAQGGLCFFCKKPLAKEDASVEHLVATANGGNNNDENCVACCKAINALLGSMSLKEKVQVVLNQQGQFKCPNGTAKAKPATPVQSTPSTISSKADHTTERLALIVANLKQRGNSKPRTIKTLTSTIDALFQKKLAPSELRAVVQKLQLEGTIAVDGTKVSYDLSE
jgi:hypothetical protein